MSRGVIAFTMGALLLSFSFSAAAVDKHDAFRYKVCKILDRPFSGSITFGGSDGCTWANLDAGDDESENAQATAAFDLKEEEIAQAEAMWLESFKEAAKTGIAQLSLLKACGADGWRLEGRMPGKPPNLHGFFRCNGAFVLVTTQGTQSTAQFDKIVNGIVPLVMMEK